MASTNSPPPSYPANHQQHEPQLLLIPHHYNVERNNSSNPLASTPAPTTESLGSIYLQEEDDEVEEDAATSSTSGGSSSRHLSNVLPATVEEDEEEIDCESALLELQDEDDDEESGVRQLNVSNPTPPTNNKVYAAGTKKPKVLKQSQRRLLNRGRARSRGYGHLSDEQNGYVDAVLSQEEALKHVRIVDTCVVVAGFMCLLPVLQAALVAPAGNTSWHFYQSVGTQLVVVAVSQVSLAMLYDTHSALLSYVGRMTLTIKILNWLWLMFVVALPVGSILVIGGKSHFGYIVIIMLARFVTALMLWSVRSTTKTWKHDVAPRFPVMLRSFVDCALLVGALFLSLASPGYLSALLLVAGPVVTRCLLVAFPGLNFD